MENKHPSYFREGDGKCAILFIHGILGTPNHFNRFIPSVPGNFAVYNLLLDGHGSGPREFSHTSMRRWRQQVSVASERLCLRYERVMIFAHSMGTLFAIEEAEKHPDKIKQLFLLNVPFYPSVKLSAALVSCKVVFDRVSPDDVWANAARDCFGITPTRNLLRYVTWLPRYIELFSEMKRVRSSLSELKVPATAFQSAHDELVARHASLRILMSHPVVKTYVMCGSGHFFIEKKDLDNVLRVFKKALRSMNEE